MYREGIQSFALLTVLPGMVVSILVTGCGGSPQDEAAAVAKLKEQKILVVPDADGLASSINLLSITDREKAPEAITWISELVDPDSLNLQGMPIDDDDLARVGQIRSLKELVVNQTPITDSGIEHLSGLSKLSTLYLSNTEITNKSLPLIGQMSDLVILDLSSTNVSSDLEPLKGLEELDWILLCNLEVPDGAFTALASLPKLSKVSLQGAKYNEKALADFLKAKSDITVQTGPSLNEASEVDTN